MAVNKVVYAGTTLIDLSQDTVTADTLLSGYTAHDKAGNKITGRASSGGGLPTSITAGDTPVLASSKFVVTITDTSMTDTGINITVPRSGTYRFKFSCSRSSTSGTWTTQLYKNGSAVSGATVSWSSYEGTCTADIACSAGDVISIYARSRSSIYRNIIGQLIACIDWDLGW